MNVRPEPSEKKKIPLECGIAAMSGRAALLQTHAWFHEPTASRDPRSVPA
jgi:hypothetical protein